MLAQVIVGLDSQMYQVTLHMGHNNDPGAWNISGVRSYVELRNVKLSADGGTSLSKLYTLYTFFVHTWAATSTSGNPPRSLCQDLCICAVTNFGKSENGRPTAQTWG
jgi:hypothetical protein